MAIVIERAEMRITYANRTGNCSGTLANMAEIFGSVCFYFAINLGVRNELFVGVVG